MGQRFRMVADYDPKEHVIGKVIQVAEHGLHVIHAVSPIPDGKANFVVEKVTQNRKTRRANQAKDRK